MPYRAIRGQDLKVKGLTYEDSVQQSLNALEVEGYRLISIEPAFDRIQSPLYIFHREGSGIRRSGSLPEVGSSN
jgi:hypothetical protein